MALFSNKCVKFSDQEAKAESAETEAKLKACGTADLISLALMQFHSVYGMEILSCQRPHHPPAFLLRIFKSAGRNSWKRTRRWPAAHPPSRVVHCPMNMQFPAQSGTAPGEGAAPGWSKRAQLLEI